MKLATLDWYWGRRTAVVLADEVVDLNGAYAARLHQDLGLPRDLALARAARDMPAAIVELLQTGPDALSRAAETASWISAALTSDPDRLVSLRWNARAVSFAPTVPNPSKIWCQGANYGAHKDEMAQRLNVEREPDRLRGFIKAPSALIGAFGDIVYPPETAWVDHEMELAVVINRYARRVPEDRAMECVAGYVAFDDVSSRDIPKLDQNRLDRGKGFDTFAVMGPWLVTPDEVPDPHHLSVKLAVNGEVKQDGNTDDMVFGIPAQIAWLSSSMTLLPGDIISTGTPSGVSRLAVGDLIEGSVENVGQQANRVVADPLTTRGL